MATVKLRQLTTAKGLTAHELELFNYNYWIIENALNSVGAVSPVAPGLPPPATVPIRHDQLLELTDDDHLQYLLLSGRGGQAVTGPLTLDGSNVVTLSASQILINKTLDAATILSGLTLGSVLFGGASSVFAQDNSKFFWNNINKMLAIGHAAPALALDIIGTTDALSAIAVSRSGGKFAALNTGTSGSSFFYDQTGRFFITPAALKTSNSIDVPKCMTMFGGTGNTAFGSITEPNIKLLIHNNNAANPVLQVKGMNVQTGDLQQWANNAGTVLSKVTSAGVFEGLISVGSIPAHASTHRSGGSDAIKLDDLAAPDDNTDLDATITKHGLMKKFPGGITTFLRADDTFVIPEAFPIGAVFIAVVATNPNTLLGYGTWSAFATGRVLVGLNSADTDFDVVEETGGAKTVASAGTNGVNSAVQEVFAGLGPTVAADAHTHTYTGSATSVVQPYIVVYIWKRTL